MDPAKRSRENFCLAVDGWTEIEEDKENAPPPAKQRRMSLSLPKDKSRKTRTTATVDHTKRVKNYVFDILFHISGTKCPMIMLQVPL